MPGESEEFAMRRGEDTAQPESRPAGHTGTCAISLTTWKRQEESREQAPTMLERLRDIDLVVLDAAVAGGEAGRRARRLLANRQRLAPARPAHLLLHAHSSQEEEGALAVAKALAPLVAAFHLRRLKSRADVASEALALHRQLWPDVPEVQRKARMLLLIRRGGAGTPQFIAPFVGGAGTTCGAWTPIVAYRRGHQTWIAGTRSREEEREAEPIRGFLRGNYAQGVCPVECSFCYLRGLQGMGLKSVALNLEDVTAELDRLPRGSVVNWAELGGPVEEDPWFVDEQGQGSLMQTILDLSSQRGIVSFFLTKGVYEPYLRLEGRLALLAISLNAPAISAIFEPGGAPPEERLRSLAWAIEHGAFDHTIRLGPIIPVAGYRAAYHELFAQIRDILGPRLKRMTVDILRFSPQMPRLLRARFPEEIVAPLLAELEPAVKAHKYRPSVHRQLRLYRWVRLLLERYGLGQVQTTPCKADPTEGRLFLKAGAITSMPCACHISYRLRAQLQQGAIPLLNRSM
jgi:DNA repair photolyase